MFSLTLKTFESNINIAVKKEVLKTLMDSNYYTTLQYQEFVDDQQNARRKNDGDKVFAKTVRSGLVKDVRQRDVKHNKYYVRVEQNKKLYDPFPLYSVSDNKNSFVDKICRPNNLYKEVTESIFNMYLSYLKTENPQWYKKTQRELSNLR